MKIQSVIISTLALTVGCDKTELEISGGDCPESEEREINEEIKARTIQMMLNSQDTGQILGLECTDICEDVSSYEGSMVEDIESCAFMLNFTELPADFFDWDANEPVGTVECSGWLHYVCMGRRPLGHIESQLHIKDIGSHFACAAQLEAASITAFVQLARQLKGWEAPQGLVNRCLKAAQDEVVHTQILRRLALDCGAELEAPINEDVSSNLLATAIHNATEGCVYETWAALIAAHQALHCTYPTLQKVYRRVAADETRHGQLAWDIHNWLMSQLTLEEQNIVGQAQAEALERLRDIATGEAKDRFLGRPTRSESREIVHVFINKLVA
jgi:hypothetical protein